MKLFTYMLPIWYSLFTMYSGHCSEFVGGYIRQDGTYVQPHFRSSPDSYRYNNYNYKPYGNIHTNGLGDSDSADSLRRSMDTDITNDDY